MVAYNENTKQQNDSISARWAGKDSIPHFFSQVLLSKYTHIALVAFALLTRLTRYAANPPIWLDEALLLDNLLSRSLVELLEPLQHQQGAPVLFLFVTKLLSMCLGISEYALRLPGCIASMVSVLLFFLLVRRVLTRYALPFALLLFGLSPTLVYYAAEVKPYAVDVLVAVFLQYYALRVLQTEKENSSWGSLIMLLVGGTLANWLSLTTPFVLAPIGIVLFLAACKHRKNAEIAFLACTGCVWVLSFLGHYHYLNQLMVDREILRSWWSHAYIPIPSRYVHVLWYEETFMEYFRDGAGLLAAGLAGVLFILGCISLWKKSPQIVMVLVGPLVMAVLASMLHLYPLTGRFLLFSIPAALILISAGLEQLRYSLTCSHSPVLLAIPLMVVTLCASPALKTAYAIGHSTRNDGVRPAVRILANQYEPEDALYIHYWATYPFLYYANRYGFEPERYVIGRTSRRDWSYYYDDLRNRLPEARRTWLLLMNIPSFLGAGEQQYMRTLMSEIGDPVEFVYTKDCVLIRYDRVVQDEM